MALVGGIKTLKWTVKIVVTLTFVIYYTCTKLYFSSAPDLSISGFVKTVVFTVCMWNNTVLLFFSLDKIIYLIWPEHPDDLVLKVEAKHIKALALVTVTFVCLLVASMVGV
ncbi:PGG domain-containing protein [Hirschfeldia incana]|nr:PGG domain-containing protein [Hirschfeldia incana]